MDARNRAFEPSALKEFCAPYMTAGSDPVSSPIRLEWRLSPAQFEEVERIVASVEPELLRRGFDEQRVNWFKIALRELVENAIEHGCRGRPHGEVRVACGLEKSALHLVVHDDGPGFDHAQKLASESDRLMKPVNRGRGLLLISRMGAQIQFDVRQGTRAEVTIQGG